MKVKVPSTEEMIKAGVHYGHKSKHWHPKMEHYIHSKVSDVHIVDLYQTQKQLEKAMEFFYKTAKSGKKIVFVGSKDQSKDTIEIEAKNCGALFVTERWFGGTLTNFDEIKRNRDELVDLKNRMNSNAFKELTKKERLLISRKIEKLEKMHGGLVGLDSLPGAIFVVDARREKTAVSEGKQTNVPVVALTDTNTNPAGIDLVIPGNDDAIKSVALIVRSISEAVANGYEEALKASSKEATKEKKQ